MNRRLALLMVLASTVMAVRTASAQSPGPAAGQGEVTIGYQGLPYKSSGETATGIQVSEGVIMHVGAGAEAGYDSNVFYEGFDPRGAAILRTSLFADASNASRSGQVGRLLFQMRGGVTYRRYQSDDPQVQNFSNAWMPTAGLALSMSSGQVGFGLADTFVRLEDPPYNPNQLTPITRYNNQGSAELRWAPGGGRLTGTLRYINMIDWLEGTYSYASSMTNTGMLDLSWKWLPKTALFVNVSQGIVTYLEANTPKQASYPLRASAGLRGLLTEKTSVIVALGYSNAFYSSGVSTGGFYGSTYADLSLTVRPTMLSRAVLGYRHAFENSVISNFYYAETAYASYVQQIAGRFALDLSGRYVYKNYQGTQIIDPTVADRADNFFQVGATLDYFMRNWVYAGVGYALLVNRGDVTPAPGAVVADVDYTKQQVFFRLGITY